MPACIGCQDSAELQGVQGSPLLETWAASHGPWPGDLEETLQVYTSRRMGRKQTITDLEHESSGQQAVDMASYYVSPEMDAYQEGRWFWGS